MRQAEKGSKENYERNNICQAEHCRAIRLAAIALGLDLQLILGTKQRRRSDRRILLSPLSPDQGLKKYHRD